MNIKEIEDGLNDFANQLEETSLDDLFKWAREQNYLVVAGKGRTTVIGASGHILADAKSPYLAILKVKMKCGCQNSTKT